MSIQKVLIISSVLVVMVVVASTQANRLFDDNKHYGNDHYGRYHEPDETNVIVNQQNANSNYNRAIGNNGYGFRYPGYYGFGFPIIYNDDRKYGYSKNYHHSDLKFPVHLRRVGTEVFRVLRREGKDTLVEQKEPRDYILYREGRREIIEVPIYNVFVIRSINSDTFERIPCEGKHQPKICYEEYDDKKNDDKKGDGKTPGKPTF